jgi:hypothetical protein
MKYIACECCNFLAAIPKHDDHANLDCPFCKRVKCEHGGRFALVTREKFMVEAAIDGERA